MKSLKECLAIQLFWQKFTFSQCIIQGLTAKNPEAILNSLRNYSIDLSQMFKKKLYSEDRRNKKRKSPQNELISWDPPLTMT